MKENIVKSEENIDIIITRLEARLDELKSAVIKWMFIMWITQIAFMLVFFLFIYK